MNVSYVGTIHSGFGTAKDYVAKQYYFAYFSKFLGQEPFLGTLNVHLDQEDIAGFYEALNKMKAHVIPGISDEGTELWGIKCYFVTIKRYPRKDRGQKCLALNFDRPDHPLQVVELVAPGNLRKNLLLKDGTRVTITIIDD
ncbi:MAG TPA: DUF120 domain-containing protein [Candidatus Lokiarchaeia archaeon]|nr:DUF120 domain-containing protein [Candidatus Lokiarchaeia archaeon]